MNRLSKHPMTEIVAQREFELCSNEGSVSVIVSLGRPALMPDAPYGDWYCPW
jgi:hypothetical protein